MCSHSNSRFSASRRQDPALPSGGERAEKGEDVIIARGSKPVARLTRRVRLLFDTHALFWWLDGDRPLSLKARRAIASESNSILVSAVSAWEITTKARLGKLPGATDPVPTGENLVHQLSPLFHAKVVPP